jgi:hypothetical protein
MNQASRADSAALSAPTITDLGADVLRDACEPDAAEKLDRLTATAANVAGIIPLAGQNRTPRHQPHRQSARP